MKAAELFVKCLENEGVEYMFGVPGEENVDIMDALLESPIKFITTRHEQGAAFMADVYGRLTGKAGVCLSTLGPGATNLITGVADADMDRAPVVAMRGQAPPRACTKSHRFDLVNMFEPINKYATQIREPEIVTDRTQGLQGGADRKPGAASSILRTSPAEVAGKTIEGKTLPPLPILRSSNQHVSSLRPSARSSWPVMA
jgi:acetolactate synthase-1/2/3 large subunit